MRTTRTKSWMRGLVAGGAAIALMLGAATTGAQTKKAPKAAKKGAPAAAAAGEGGEASGEKKDSEESPKVKVERGAGGKKVYVIKTGFVIEGRIQKPNAFYVLQRSQINYDWAALKQDFVPKILDSVRKSPF
jgi:hypothetical protein